MGLCCRHFQRGGAGGFVHVPRERGEMRWARGARKEKGFPKRTGIARALEHQLPRAARGVQESALSRGSRDAHMLPTGTATAFTSPKSSQGRCSLWGQQGWGSSCSPGQGGGAEEQGGTSARGKLMGQNLARCAGLGMPKEGQTRLWQCRSCRTGPAELGSASAMFRLETRTSPHGTLSGREECEGHGAHQCCGGPVP